MSRWVVDRIEGDIAILEGADGPIERPLRELPEGVREGDALDAHLRPLPPAARDEAEARLERLRARSPADDEGEILL